MTKEATRILITGATGTIGRASASRLASEDASLFLHCHRSSEGVIALGEELAGKARLVETVCSDISVPSMSGEIIANCIRTIGGIDVLVHCASTFEKTPLGSVTEEGWRAAIDSNMGSAFFIAQAAAEAMEADGGSMIFFSDTAVARPYGGYLPYCMAKAGIETMVRGLARTLAPKIRVNAIAPYAVSKPDDMTDKGWTDLINKTPMRKPTSAEEIASLVRWLALDAETTTGQIITVDGGRLLR